jgi:hypothetical protein
MQFRWAVGIALWTLLAGPVLGPPLRPAGTSSAAPPRPMNHHVPQPNQPHP